MEYSIGFIREKEGLTMDHIDREELLKHCRGKQNVLDQIVADARYIALNCVGDKIGIRVDLTIKVN